jgi:hypothetical protein
MITEAAAAVMACAAARTLPLAGSLALCAALGGCAVPTTDVATGLRVSAERAVPFPAGSAHATFQHGRVVRQASLFEPYCQLEVDTVVPRKRVLAPGRWRVTRIGTRILRDPITRIPLLHPRLDCNDGIYQESIWRLAPDAPGANPVVRHLRCIAPYSDCRFGPPLAMDQMQQVVGPYLSVTRQGP